MSLARKKMEEEGNIEQIIPRSCFQTIHDTTLKILDNPFRQYEVTFCRFLNARWSFLQLKSIEIRRLAFSDSTIFLETQKL